MAAGRIGCGFRRGLVAGCCLLALAGGARAQNSSPAPGAEPQTVDNVVVTAQKRKEKLQKVPVAVTVIEAAQLQRQQIETVQDLAGSAASLEFAPTSNAPGGGAVVRGIGTETFQPGAQASVGVVVDGVPLGNLNTNNLFDISRVEVLRGPQGMLFGSSTSAGVINITTTAPDPTAFSASFHSDSSAKGVGSPFGNQIANLVVNVPLSPDAAVRVSAFGNYIEGLYHDNYTNKDNWQADQGLRANLLWRPNADLTISLIADYEKINTQGYDLFVADSGIPQPTLSYNQACGIHQGPHNQNDCSNYPNFSRTTNAGVSGEVDWDTAIGTLTDIASFRLQDVGPNSADILGDGPQQVPALFRPGQTQHQDQATEELRLTSPAGQVLQYTAGFFYSHYDGMNGGGPLQIILPFATLYSAVNDHSTIDAKALYGQLTYHVAPHLRLIAGGRLQQERVTDTGTAINSPNPFAPPTYTPVGGAGTINNASWRVGAEYDLTRTIMAYATATRGYKGPQVSDQNPLVPAAIIKPEIPLDFELGMKGAVLQDRLAVDLNLFHTAIKDFQAQSCAFVPQIVCTPNNISSVTTQGVELDLFGHPTRNLSINSSLLYDDVRYPNGFLGSDGTNLSGATLENATRFKFTTTAEYDWALADGGQPYVDGSAIYRSDLRLYPSANPEFVVPAHWTLGTRLGYRSPNRGWGIAVYVKNLLNTPEPVQIYANNPGAVYVLGPDSFRQVGLTLDAKF